MFARVISLWVPTAQELHENFFGLALSRARFRIIHLNDAEPVAR